VPGGCLLREQQYYPVQQPLWTFPNSQFDRIDKKLAFVNWQVGKGTKGGEFWEACDGVATVSFSRSIPMQFAS
jgi:hypothetical protein